MKVVAIDLDGTALEYPEKVNELKRNSQNFIVIYTARDEERREATIKELLDAGVKYHALVMNKINADVFIDDKNAGGLNWSCK